MKRALLLSAALALFASGETAHAQLGWNTRAPFHNGGHSFFERFGFGFSLAGPGFSFNSGMGANPAFGGFQPGAGISGGQSTTLGGGMRLNWFAEASQGARSSFSSQTPVLTGLNGQTGYFADASQSPFVIGVVPVVGGMSNVGAANTVEGRLLRGEMWYDADGQLHFGPDPAVTQTPRPRPRDAAPPAAVAAGRLAVAAAGAGPAKSHDEGELRIASSDPAEAAPRESAVSSPAGASSAESGAESLAEMAAKKGHEQAAGDAEGQDFLAKGKQAEAAGKLGAAKAYYRMGLKKASGGLLSELQTRLDAVLARQ